MRTLIFLMVSFFFAIAINGQKVHGLNDKISKVSSQILHKDGPSVICYHSEEIIHEYVAARRNKITYKNAAPLQFNVSYEPSVRFPQEIKDALEIGTLPLVSELFQSDVPINIFVDEINQEGALAAAGPTAFVPFMAESPCFNCYIPVPLAEKIRGINFNENEPDLVVFINLNQENFYFDYENPENILQTQFDFVTVMFHELIHGMGFTGFAEVTSDATGRLTDDRFTALLPQIFDEYLETGNGGNIRETLEENSLRMGTAFSNNDLFFNAFKVGQVDDRAKLYAPRDYSSGSSIHHVDEGTYQSGADALMTPTANRGQVLRDGGIAIEMMYDMGWVITKLDFTDNETATEELDQDLTLRTLVTSDIAYDASSLKLHFSTDTFATETIVVMDPSTDPDMFETIIAATGGPQDIQYYAEVTDSRGVTRTTPSPAPEFYFSYEFLLDTEGPEILHDEITSLKEVDNISSIDITADLTDALNIESGAVEWRINMEDAINVEMLLFNEDSSNPFAENEYIATLDFGRNLTAADILEYRIVATDSSKARNISTYPEDGSFISIPVQGETPPVNFYFNDFNEETDDFEGNGFSITTPRNFSNPAIHSNHPYANAGGGNSLNLTFELKIPIVIEEQRPVIEFEEVVLVEPGNSGVPFGMDEFWDYVIVEGKKRGTQEWLPFLDGYDSQENSTWQSAYENSINGSTCESRSVSTGRSSQLQIRKINMVENQNFAFGDTVSIRFRLFSDPCLGGWGWVIDNLAIQDLNSDIEEFVIESNFDIIPNPAFDQVTVALDLESTADQAVISIVDMMGRVIMTKSVGSNTLYVRERLDITELPDGIYFVNVAFNNKDVISKKLVKQ